MSDTFEAEEKAEGVATSVAKRLHAWIKQRTAPTATEATEGQRSGAVRGSYDSPDAFAASHKDGIDNVYTYSHGPISLQRMCEPCKDGNRITSKMALDPLQFHLHGTRVFVFNPFHYKNLWQVKEVSGCVPDGWLPVPVYRFITCWY